MWANEGLVVNASNGIALWNLRRLGAKRQLQIVVYAVNARGRSEHIKFTVETAPRLSPRTGTINLLFFYCMPPFDSLTVIIITLSLSFP